MAERKVFGTGRSGNQKASGLTLQMAHPEKYSFEFIFDGDCLLD
jgi:hypothetical protein